MRFSHSGVGKNKILKAVNSVLPKNKAIHEFGLVFVSAKKMAELNKKYRGKAKPTNVLSFETGDVVVCPAVAAREAKKYGFTHKNWMTRLIVHGILHLAGYDHKKSKEGMTMKHLEDKVCGKLGFDLSGNSKSQIPNPK